MASVCSLPSNQHSTYSSLARLHFCLGVAYFKFLPQGLLHMFSPLRRKKQLKQLVMKNPKGFSSCPWLRLDLTSECDAVGRGPSSTSILHCLLAGFEFITHRHILIIIHTYIQTYILHKKKTFQVKLTCPVCVLTICCLVLVSSRFAVELMKQFSTFFARFGMKGEIIAQIEQTTHVLARCRL